MPTESSYNANQSVILKFEKLHMTPIEIAADEELEVGAVKAILMQNSTLYRNQCKREAANPQGPQFRNFTQDEHEKAMRIIVNLMNFSEDENLQARLAMYVNDDCKGRLDSRGFGAGLNINILAFNENMRKAMKACEEVATPENRAIEAEVVEQDAIT